jgi:hypothetical protein
MITFDKHRIWRVTRRFTDKETAKEIERGQKTIDFYKNPKIKSGHFLMEGTRKSE